MRLPDVDEADLRAFAYKHLGAQPGEMRTHVDHADHLVVELALPTDDAILKTGLRDHFGLEAWACERARGLGVPAPDVLVVDDIPEELPHSALLLRKVPGLPIRELEGEDAADAVREAGRHLRAIHEIALPGSGWADPDAHRADGDVRGRDNDWPSTVRRELGWGLGYLEDRRLVPRELAGRIRAAQEDHTQGLEAVDDLRFLHGDPGASHLLVDPATGDLTAIIDWADLQVGDPAWELSMASAWAVAEAPEGSEGSRRSWIFARLLEAYEPGRDLGDRLEALGPLYHCMRLAWITRWSDERNLEIAPILRRLNEVASNL